MATSKIPLRRSLPQLNMVYGGNGRDVDVFGLPRRPARGQQHLHARLRGGVFPAGEQATVAACFRPETEGLLSDFRRPHDDFFFIGQLILLENISCTHAD